MKNLQVLKPFYRTSEISKLIEKCCDEGWTGIGGNTIKFEEEWKKYSCATTCHMLNSATSGLHLALYQLKLKNNWQDDDEVLTTPLTFVSSNHAILYNNLKPVFVDIDESGCLDPLKVLDKLTSKTKAILFVGLGGNTGSLLEVINVAKAHNLKVILDAAHMAGTKWKDTLQQVGCSNLEAIDVTVFSGQAVKQLCTADSGWVCWNGKDALEQDALSRKLSWLGIDKDTFSRSNNQGSYKWHYEVPYLGYKFHSNSIMGAFALVALKYLDQDNSYRRHLAEVYTNKLQNNSKIKIVTHNENCISGRHIFQILVDKRDEVMLALNQVGICPGVHYRDNTLYSMYDYAKGTCPKAEEFSNKTISLPLHLHLTVEDIKYVCDKLNEILK